jgi:hypothetical protein
VTLTEFADPFTWEGLFGLVEEREVGAFMIPSQVVACAGSVAGDIAYSLPSRSWIRPARIWRCTAMPTWFGRSLGHAEYSSCRVLPVARARTRSPRFGALGLRSADSLVAVFGGRPRRPRVAVGAFTSAAEADLGLLPDGALLTRVSTRSAVSRSINSVAIFARSASRRASRSLTLVFSALIWFNIVGVVVGMVTFSSFRSIRMINLVAV